MHSQDAFNESTALFGMRAMAQLAENDAVPEYPFTGRSISSISHFVISILEWGVES
jgi:hypothetical protein